MKQAVSKSRLWPVLFRHLPLIGVFLIILYFTLLDSPVLERFRNEQAYAWMLVIWIPLGILLGLIQLYIWLRWFIRRASSYSRKIVKAGFIVIIAIFIFFIALRYLY